jgi:hypothetical protein
MSRRLRRGLMVLAGVLVLVAGGGYLLLNSGYTRGLVARQVSAAVGLPVTVTHLSVGRSASTVGLSVGDFLTVASATLDVPLAKLVRGDVGGGTLTLSGVRVELRLDANGKFLTPLPKGGGGGGAPQVPPIRLTDATVVFNQEGRPPFTLRNVSGDLTPVGDSLKLTATADDPDWGAWAATGTIDPATADVRVELSNPAAPLRLDLLRGIPFVPPETWDQVHPSGSSPVTVALSYLKDDFTYAVTLAPRGATLGLPALETTFDNLSGTIRVGGPVVTLEGATAGLAGGTVTVDGKLDFGPDPSALTFQVSGTGIDVKGLPAAWNLPKQIGGRLRGAADLTVLLHPGGRVETRGDGRAELDGATVAGLPAEVKLRLRSDGRRFRFEEGEQAGRANLLPLLVLLQPPAPPPSSFGASVTLRDVDIAELLERLEVTIDYKLTGRVTVVARVAVPLNDQAEAPNTTVRGTLTSKQLGFEGLTARDVSADLLYTNGVLTLTKLSAAFDPEAGGKPGTLAGTATAAVNPRGDVTAKLTLDGVPLGQVLKAVPGGPFPAAGPVSGTAEFKAPFDKLADAGSWTASGVLTSPTITAAGRAISEVKLPLKVSGGKADLVAAAATVEGIPLTADATVTLAGSYPFTAAAKTTPRQVSALTKLVPELTVSTSITGKLTLTAKAAGTLSPTTVTADGRVSATELTVGRSTANAVSANWKLTPERIVVTALEAAVFGGKLTGSADVPFAADKPGKFDVNLADVDSAGIVAAVPDIPVRVTGKLSGRVAGTLPPGPSRTATAEVKLSAPRLTVQGIPAERLEGEMTVRGGGLDYKLTGKALGGDFKVEGRYPDGGGKVSLDRADLRRLRDAVPGTEPLSGRVSLVFDYSPGLSAGDGLVEARGVRWNNGLLVSEVRGKLSVNGDRLSLTDVTGRLADGALRGSGNLNLRRPTDNVVRLTVTGADGRRLTAPFAGDGFLSGEVGATARLRVYPAVAGTVEVTVPRGQLAGLTVTGVRLPAEFDADGRVTVRAATGLVGDGRAEVDARLDGTGRLVGQARFRNLRLSQLGGPERLVGGGRLTGRFDFGGERVRSVNDVAGTLVGTITQANAREIPLLDVAVPLLNPTALARPFDRGDLRGRLRNGVFRLERLALANDEADLFADGTITTAGRLDVHVVARTGNLSGGLGVLRAFGGRLPVFGPIPVGLILDISEFLSNRTVRVDIAGTTRQPVARVNTTALLAEEAVRFLLARYLPGVQAVRQIVPEAP